MPADVQARLDHAPGRSADQRLHTRRSAMVHRHSRASCDLAGEALTCVLRPRNTLTVPRQQHSDMLQDW